MSQEGTDPGTQDHLLRGLIFIPKYSFMCFSKSTRVCKQKRLESYTRGALKRDYSCNPFRDACKMKKKNCRKVNAVLRGAIEFFYLHIILIEYRMRDGANGAVTRDK